MHEVRVHPTPFSQASIEQALLSVPEGAHGAVLLYATTTEMKFGVMAKTPDGKWSFAGNLEKEFRGPWSIYAEVRHVW